MQREKFIIDGVGETPAITVAGECVNRGEDCHYCVKYSGDAANTWPEGYIGRLWLNGQPVAMKAGETFIIRTGSSTSFEFHGQGV